MTTLTLELSDKLLSNLTNAAARNNVSLEVAARAAIEHSLSERPQHLDTIIAEVVRENRGLYRRLSTLDDEDFKRHAEAAVRKHDELLKRLA